MNERRNDFRHFVNAPVMISHSSFGGIKALTGDISNTGVFVFLPEKPKLPKGAHIKLQFLRAAIPDVVFNTRVVRSTEKGFALVFVDYERNGVRYAMSQLHTIWSRQSIMK